MTAVSALEKAVVFRFTCPGCSKLFKAGPAIAGRQMECKRCGLEFRIPTPEPDEAPIEPTPPPVIDFDPAMLQTDEFDVTGPSTTDAEPVLDVLPVEMPASALDAGAIVELLRPIAERHKLKKVAASLGQLKPKKVANARRGFAAGMSDHETAIAQIDTSFFQNGAKGLLLTDRRVYSSFLPEGMELSQIRRVTWEPPMEGLVVQPGKLLVNGRHLFTGRFSKDFWMEALAAVGQAARGESAGERPRPEEPRPARGGGRVMEDWVHLAAAAVCNNAEFEAIVDELRDAGATRKCAEQLAEELVEIRQRPQSTRAALHIGGGFIAAVVGAGVTLASFSSPSSDGTVLVVYGPVIWGMFYGVRGLYRSAIGGWPMATSDLVKIWVQEHPQAAARWQDDA